jgi:hypothetical protein
VDENKIIASFEEWFQGWGGPGSGHRGHKGIPGQRGGSVPGMIGGGGFPFAEWEDLSVPDRKAKFLALSQEEQDRLADPTNSVFDTQRAILKDVGDRPTDGSPRNMIRARLGQVGELISQESVGLISKVANETDTALEKAGASAEARQAIAMELVDSMVSQDFEAMSRTLGDHGAYHLEGNARMAEDVLGVIPGAKSPANTALVNLAAAFHDAGYMTGPSKVFMDEGHPRWSKQHYDANLAPLVEKALGSANSKMLGKMISTHADTAIDYKDPAATAFRLSDNLALFHREKMPAVLRHVPDNVGVLKSFARKEIGVRDAQVQMVRNIDGAGLPKRQAGALKRAVLELNPITPKLTLGMLAGDVNKINWRKDHVHVSLRRNAEAAQLQKVLDLGQRQFGKFAKTYGVNQDTFARTGRANVLSRGRTVLSFETVGEMLRSAFEELFAL